MRCTLTTREEHILEASLVAAFKIDDTMAQIEWKLRNVGGAWKIADIASMTKDWALSQFNCE